MYEAICLEMLKTEREAYRRAIIKITADQLGEAFIGLDDRRTNDTHMRGPDRRENK